jgi:hypothetical protein
VSTDVLLSVLFVLLLLVFLFVQMDRTKPSEDLAQFAFINIVVLPLFSQLSEVLSCGILSPCIQNLVSNRGYYSARISAAKLVQKHADKLKSRRATAAAADAAIAESNTESTPRALAADA